MVFTKKYITQTDFKETVKTVHILPMKDILADLLNHFID